MEKQERKSESVLNSTILTDGPDDEQEAAGGEGELSAERPETPADQPQKVSIGRRQRARERDERLQASIDSMREAQEQRDREHREELAAVRRENAERFARMEGYAMRQQQEPAQRREEAPDPDKLEAEAIAALDRKDFATYQRKMREAAKADVMRDLAPRFSQQQAQPQGPQIHPLMAAMAAQYTDVTNDAEALAVASAHDNTLAAQGVPNGPDRWKRGFERARAYVKTVGGKQQNGGPTFQQRNRDVVAGVPTGTSGGSSRSGGEGPGVILSPEERATARRFKMSEQDYATELAAMHPERVQK